MRLLIGNSFLYETLKFFFIINVAHKPSVSVKCKSYNRNEHETVVKTKLHLTKRVVSQTFYADMAFENAIGGVIRSYLIFKQYFRPSIVRRGIPYFSYRTTR